jgi:hypothetical protein
MKKDSPFDDTTLIDLAKIHFNRSDDEARKSEISYLLETPGVSLTNENRNSLLRFVYFSRGSARSMVSMRREILTKIGYISKSTYPSHHGMSGNNVNREELEAIYNYVMEKGKEV